MNQGHVRDASPGRGRHAFLLAVGVGAVGMIMMHYPMIASGLARVQTDVGDTRLIQYFLEHNYRWFRGDPDHARIWDPPFFYPARNVAAHSDTMMAAAPLYGAFRAAGLAPDTSFQLWMMAISALNYAAAFHLLRRRIRVSVPSASAGAFLFAFGNMRAYQLGHQQLMPQFLGVIAVDALFGLFPARAIPWWRRAFLWAAVPAGVIAQLTSGVYLGWFLIFSLGIAAAVAVWLPSTRWPFLAVLRRDAPWIALSAILGWLVLRIWVSHQVAASLELGTRYLQYVVHCLPHPLAWLCVSQSSWLEGWTIGLVERLGWQVENWQPCGIGLVTTAAGSAGLYLARERPWVRLLVMVSFVLFASVTVLPGEPLAGLAMFLTLGAGAIAFQRRRDDPLAFLGFVALVLLALKVAPANFAAPLRSGVGLYTLVIALLAFERWEGTWFARFLLGVLMAGLVFVLMPAWLALSLGAVFGGLLAAAAAVCGWRSRRQIESVTLGGTLFFSALVSYLDVPWMLGVAASAFPAVVAAKRISGRFRISAWQLLSIAGSGLIVLVLFNSSGIAWFIIYNRVPGASALLFISRVSLMMLIPWAIGLGLFFDVLIERRRTLLALTLGVVCLAEQGVSTPSFDKRANRDDIATLARRVNRRADAFYYSPRNSPYPSWKANLDAMWAGLESGVPTINGYSGGTPVGWRSLEDSNVRGLADLYLLEDHLAAWRETHGRDVRRVWWIGGPLDGWVVGEE